VQDIEIFRLDFGYFLRPAEETGTGRSRVEPCLGYLLKHHEGVLLFDTGMGAHPEVDAHYQPQRRDLPTALADAGTTLDDINVVTNCHLHFDHCGGNPLLTQQPIFVQRTELSAARTTVDYTLPDLVESGRYEEVNGEVEVLPGVLLIPTPGHTEGHQSLVARRADGTVVVAGQSHDTASAYAADVLAGRARAENHSGPLPETPSWMQRLLEFDPRRVYFAHDHSVWVP
jgi:N-acyl homoserine lactone hydrolase